MAYLPRNSNAGEVRMSGYIAVDLSYGLLEVAFSRMLATKALPKPYRALLKPY